MDPITRVARDFMDSWLRFRQSEKARFFRIDTDPSMHRDLWRVFRAIEMSPDNRSPYFILDTPLTGWTEFFEAATQKVTSDYKLVQEGFAKDSVRIPELDIPADLRMKPEEGFVMTVKTVWENVKQHFEYLTLIFLPGALGSTVEWTRAIEVLLQSFSAVPIRIAAADTSEGVLSELCARNPKAAFSGSFFISPAKVQEYLFKIAEGGWGALSNDGSKVNNPKPASTAPVKPSEPSNGNSPADAQARGGPVLPPDEAARLRTFMAKAATAAGEHKIDESLDALRSAQVICANNGLSTHEAIIIMAIANTLLGDNRNTEAIEQYNLAVSTATSASSAVVVMQARFGTAATWFRIQDYPQAAATYEQAAEDALVAESDVMRIEALRMAGTCHTMQSKFEDAAKCWSTALAGAETISLSEIEGSTVLQLGEQFVALCEKRGLVEQAKSVRQQLELIQAQAAERDATATAALHAA